MEPAPAWILISRFPGSYLDCLFVAFRAFLIAVLALDPGEVVAVGAWPEVLTAEDADFDCFFLPVWRTYFEPLRHRGAWLYCGGG